MSETVIRGTNVIFIDGCCPFLTCLETSPHGHDICPDCRAVKFGNAFCATCRSHWPGGDPLASSTPLKFMLRAERHPGDPD